MDCSICLIKIREPNATTLSCSHKFHVTCIDSWFKKKNNCPFCRTVQTTGFTKQIRTKCNDITKIVCTVTSDFNWSTFGDKTISFKSEKNFFSYGLSFCKKNETVQLFKEGNGWVFVFNLTRNEIRGWIPLCILNFTEKEIEKIPYFLQISDQRVTNPDCPIFQPVGVDKNFLYNLSLKEVYKESTKIDLDKDSDSEVEEKKEPEKIDLDQEINRLKYIIQQHGGLKIAPFVCYKTDPILRQEIQARKGLLKKIKNEKDKSALIISLKKFIDLDSIKNNMYARCCCDYVITRGINKGRMCLAGVRDLLNSKCSKHIK